MKRFIADFLLAGILFLAGSTRAESVKRSLYIEGTVVGAQRFRRGIRYTTKISFREDVEHEAAESRRFCGDWQGQINRLRGKHIRLALKEKEYAPGECQKINGIELLNNPAHSN